MNNVPWTTVAVFAISCTAIVILIVSGHSNSELINTLSILLPGILSASFFTERSNKQLNNGTLTAKVKEGATQALNETGITAVAAQSGNATQLAMDALAKLLQLNTAATQVNTQAHQAEGPTT